MATHSVIDLARPRDLGAIATGVRHALEWATEALLGTAVLLFAPVAALNAYVLWVLFQTTPGQGLTLDVLRDPANIGRVYAFLGVAVFASRVAGALVSGICARGLAALAAGDAPTPASVFVGVRPVAFRLVVQSLLVIAVVVLLGATLILIPLAIILIVRWTVAAPVLAIEGGGVLQALRRSSALVRGSWKRVLGITLAGQGASAVVVLLIAQLLDGLFGGPIVSPLISCIAEGVLAAIAALIAAFLYFDLRARAGDPWRPPAPVGPAAPPT